MADKMFLIMFFSVQYVVQHSISMYSNVQPRLYVLILSLLVYRGHEIHRQSKNFVEIQVKTVGSNQ